MDTSLSPLHKSFFVAPSLTMENNTNFLVRLHNVKWILYNDVYCCFLSGSEGALVRLCKSTRSVSKLVSKTTLAHIKPDINDEVKPADIMSWPVRYSPDREGRGKSIQVT